jgi:hypothetical protein
MPRLARAGAKPSRLRVLALAALACIAAGCALDTPYQRPELDVPQDFRFGEVTGPVSALAELPEEPPFGELLGRGGGGGGGGGASKVVTSVKTKRSGFVWLPLRSNDAMKTSASTSPVASEAATQRRCRTVIIRRPSRC